ncbi:MAG: CDP-diacylglycerol--serine O-phosphatidyltransferase [Anaerolineae bacterium]|nr:CDP-diacylglycerol--serine O-phosphatidyltransferase [Anaerolineae bacterium]
MPGPKVKTAVPGAVTISSLVLGVLAIMVLFDDRFFLAGLLIILGSILDVLDGQLAFRLDAISYLGKELDSLADVVTFGVAPTILVYRLMVYVGVANHVAMVASLAFVLAGAYRLARYNTLPSDRRAYFKGLPIPMASLILITGSFWQHWVIHLWWTVVVVVVSCLMVSAFPYPKNVHVIKAPPLLLIMMAVVVLGWGVLAGGWQAVPFGVFVLYGLSGPVVFLHRFARHRFRLSES